MTSSEEAAGAGGIPNRLTELSEETRRRIPDVNCGNGKKKGGENDERRGLARAAGGTDPRANWHQAGDAHSGKHIRGEGRAAFSIFPLELRVDLRSFGCRAAEAAARTQSPARRGDGDPPLHLS